MVGRVTSNDPAVNAHGVPLVDVLRGKLEAQGRLNAALLNALAAWAEWDRLRSARNNPRLKRARPLIAELREAYSLAIEMTTRALL